VDRPFLRINNKNSQEEVKKAIEKEYLLILIVSLVLNFNDSHCIFIPNFPMSALRSLQ
jgi:hypothetical protein